MKKYFGLIESTTLILFGIAVVIGSLTMDYAGQVALSPGLFPLILGVLILFLAMLMLLRNIKGLQTISSDEIKTQEKVNKSSVFAAIVKGKSVLLILMCFLYIALMSWVGFIPATTIFIAGVTILLGERKWWRVILLSVLGSLLAYLAFDLGLQVHLP